MTVRMIACIILAGNLAACGSSGSSSSNQQTSQREASQPDSIEWQVSGSFENSLVFASRDTVQDRHELFRFDIALRDYVKLAPQFVANGKVSHIAVSPDMEKVAYVADQEINNRYRVYISNADGSINLSISPDSATEDAGIQRWSDDGDALFFYHDNSHYKAEFIDLEVKVSRVTASESVDSGSDKDIQGNRIYLETHEGGTSRYQALYQSANNEPAEVILDSDQPLKLLSSPSDIPYTLIKEGRYSNDSSFYRVTIENGAVDRLPLNGTLWSPVWRPNSREFVVMHNPSSYPESSESYDLLAFDMETLMSTTVLTGTNPFSSFSYTGWLQDRYLIYRARQNTSFDDLYIYDGDTKTATVLSEVVGYQDQVDDYSVSESLRIALWWNRDYSIDGEVPSKLLVTNFSGNQIIDLSEYAPQSTRGQVKWLNDNSLLLRKRATAEKVDIYQVTDINTGDSYDLSSSPNEVRAFGCLVNTNADLSPCVRIYDKT